MASGPLLFKTKDVLLKECNALKRQVKAYKKLVAEMEQARVEQDEQLASFKKAGEMYISYAGSVREAFEDKIQDVNAMTARIEANQVIINTTLTRLEQLVKKP